MTTVPSHEFLIDRLKLPTGHSRIVIDTDTYNEIDDQFAVVYALLSQEELTVEALYAAPFYNHRSDGPGQGMELSFDEIVRLLGRQDAQGGHHGTQRLHRGGGCHEGDEALTSSTTTG